LVDQLVLAYAATWPHQAEHELRYQQDTDRQERELREIAARLGHEIVGVYSDRLSGAKGPGGAAGL
jgi:hypothetical protein